MDDTAKQARATAEDQQPARQEASKPGSAATPEAWPASGTAQRLEELRSMDPNLLRRRWRSVTGRPVPPRLPVSLMVRILMWQEQIAQAGDLDPAYLAQMNACIDAGLGESVDAVSLGAQTGAHAHSNEGGRSWRSPAMCAGQTSQKPPSKASSRRRPHPPLRPGTVLVREHAGALHRVMVLKEGFAWNGQTYPSLSRVARAITGTSWNGPRFFGLDKSRARGAGGRASPDQDAAAPADGSGVAP